MSGLLIGDVGADQILTALSSTLKPLQYIEEFQQNYGLNTGNDINCTYLISARTSTLPVLKMLDLHGLSRVDVYLRLLQELRKKMIERVEQLPVKGLEPLLEQTFAYVSFDELRAVPLAIMKRMPEVPHRFLKKLSANPSLYKECSVEIKRQIWLIDEGLFRDKVFPLLNQHIGEAYEFASENPLPPARRREGDSVLQELVHLVGKSVALYNMLLHFFRTLLVSTHNSGFCTLRADLLMALHDVGISEIYHLDPCHKFAWCLDACVRDGAVELRRTKEMQYYFGSVPPADPILGDLAMIVANPHATHTLIRSIFNTLVDVVNRELIPKDDDALVYMSDLLTLGLHAESMLRDQVFHVMKTEKEILQTFYPLLAFRILDDAARTPEGSTTQGGDLKSSTTVPQRTLPPAEPLDDALLSLVYRHPLARRVMLYYLLTRISSKDSPSVEMLLSTFTKPPTSPSSSTSSTTTPAALIIPTEEPAFIQSLVTYTMNVRDARMTHVVIDTFMMSHKSESAHIHKQLVRFLVESQSRLNPRDVMLYINKILGNTNSTAPIPSLIPHLSIVSPLYRTLIEHAATNKDVNNRLTEKTVPLLFQYLSSPSPQ